MQNSILNQINVCVQSKCNCWITLGHPLEYSVNYCSDCTDNILWTPRLINNVDTADPSFNNSANALVAWYNSSLSAFPPRMSTWCPNAVDRIVSSVNWLKTLYTHIHMYMCTQPATYIHTYIHTYRERERGGEEGEREAGRERGREGEHKMTTNIPFLINNCTHAFTSKFSSDLAARSSRWVSATQLFSTSGVIYNSENNKLHFELSSAK